MKKKLSILLYAAVAVLVIYLGVTYLQKAQRVRGEDFMEMRDFSVTSGSFFMMYLAENNQWVQASKEFDTSTRLSVKDGVFSIRLADERVHLTVGPQITPTVVEDTEYGKMKYVMYGAIGNNKMFNVILVDYEDPRVADRIVIHAIGTRKSIVYNLF